MIDRLERAAEAILFSAGDPIPLYKLAEALEQDKKTTQGILNKLKDYYDLERRGVQLLEIDGKYQLATRKEYYQYIKTILETPVKFTMTDALIETLAIIAYKQPITRTQIEDIRGVRCDHVINKLIEYELITEQGRLHAPGRPILFGTTDEFLRYFGLKDSKDLPEISEELIKGFHQEVASSLDFGHDGKNDA